MPSEISAELMATAKAVRSRLCLDCECAFDRGCGCLDAIAQALLAEREATNQRWRDSDEAAREAGFMLGPSDIAEAIIAERERCAAIADGFPTQILQFWDRPGGPPGNGYRQMLPADIAAAIRQEPPK